MTDMAIYLLWIGTYEDRRIVGIFASKDRAEREILNRAYAGESLESVEIEEDRVQS